MLSQKLCGPLFLYKWNLYDHLTDVSIDYSGSHIRDNFISSNWRPLLAFFISVRNKFGIQSLVSFSLHHYGISCSFCKQLCQMKTILLPTMNHHISPCQWKKLRAHHNLVQVISDELIYPFLCRISWAIISGRCLEMDSWLQPAKYHSQNLLSVVSYRPVLKQLLKCFNFFSFQKERSSQPRNGWFYEYSEVMCKCLAELHSRYGKLGLYLLVRFPYLLPPGWPIITFFPLHIRFARKHADLLH